MTIYITKQPHYSFNYILNWYNPDTGNMMGDWFRTMKDLEEYVKDWPVTTIVKVNF